MSTGMINGKSKQIAVRLPLADAANLKIEADARGWSQSGVVLQALRAWLPVHRDARELVPELPEVPITP